MCYRLNLCISILEFKFGLGFSLSLNFSDLCISILEFKYYCTIFI